jgi:hypothetical protein
LKRAASLQLIEPVAEISPARLKSITLADQLGKRWPVCVEVGRSIEMGEPRGQRANLAPGVIRVGAAVGVIAGLGSKRQASLHARNPSPFPSSVHGLSQI